MRLFLLISVPYIRRHLWRYALLASGVALGVAVAVAVQGGAQSVMSEFRDTVARMAGRCQLQITAGEAGVPESFLERVQELKQVAAASPVIEALAELEDEGRSRVLIVAVDMTGDAGMRPWIQGTGGRSLKVDPITFLAQPDSVLLSRGFAERHGWRIGSVVPMRTAAGPKRLTVRGLLEDESVDRIYGGNVAVMDVYGAQAIFGRGSLVDRIDVVLAEGVGLEEGRRALAGVVGQGYSVEAPASRSQQFEEMLGAYQALQWMACIFATALGIAMIDASFRLAVAQRRVEIGVLRSLGATRRQVQGVFLWEGVFTGLLGSAAGLALGVTTFNWLARALGGGFRNTLGGLANQAYHLQATPELAGLALAAGCALSVTASWLPSREAAQAHPLEALQPIHFEQSLRPWRPTALLMGLAAAVVAGLGAWQRDSVVLFYGSTVLIFASVLCVLPSVVLVAVRALRPGVSTVFGLEGALALDSLVRSPRRTAASCAVLVLVMALAVMVGGIRRSTRQTLANWVEAAFSSDLLVSASPNLASQSFRFPAEFTESLRRVPGVGTVQPVRSVRAPFRNRLVLLVAADYEYAMSKASLKVKAGTWVEMCERTAAGEAVFVSELLARREGLRMGDRMEMSAPRGTLRLPVAGVVEDYSDKAGVIFLAREVYARLWNDESADKYRVDAAGGLRADELRGRIRTAIGDRFPATILTREEARDYVLRPQGRRISPVEIQLLICMLTSALALMNLAAISVAERTREFALIRSLGGFQWQLRKRLLIEVLATAGISLVLGLAVGALMLKYALLAAQRYVALIELGYSYPFGVAGALAGVAVVCGVAAMLAAVPALGQIPLSVSLDAE